MGKASPFPSTSNKEGEDEMGPTGATALLELLKTVNLNELSSSLVAAMQPGSGQRVDRAITRLCTSAPLEKAGVRPIDLVTTIIPVLPADLRPIEYLPRGRSNLSPIAYMYLKLMRRIERFQKLVELRAPPSVMLHETGLIQEAVDLLYMSKLPGHLNRSHGRGLLWYMID